MDIKIDKKVLKLLKKGDAGKLIRMASDRKNPQRRGDAIRALGELGAKEAVPTLIEILNDMTEDIGCIAAAKALGDIRDESAVPSLLEAVWVGDRVGGFNDPWSAAILRDAALDALEKIGTQAAVEALIKALGHGDENCRAKAAAKLGHLGNQLAVDALVDLTKNDRNDWVRGTAAVALARIGDPRGIEAIAHAWQVISNDNRSMIRDVLGTTAGPEALDMLNKAIQQG